MTRPLPAHVVRGALVTMDPERPRAEAMAVVGDTIAAVGTLDEARAAAGPHAPVLDLGETAVVPGLIDAHNHMLLTGLQGRLANLGGARSVAEVLERVARWAAEHPDARWVVSSEGWHVDDLAERRHPTREELDRICPDRPVFLPRVGHTAAVNSRALELAGVGADTPDPQGGAIERGPDGRQPTGLLIEQPARRLVADHMPPLSRAERIAALREVQARYHAAGLVRVQEPASDADELDAYQALHAQGGLTMRVTAMPVVGGGAAAAAALERVRGLGVRTGFGDERLMLGGLKVFLDGGASLGTAYLREEWPGRPGYRGELVASPELLEQVAETCARERWSLGVHAVGGGAIDLALAAFERAHARHPIDDLRFTLIHAYLWPSAENVAAARRLGVVVAAQATMQERFAGIIARHFGWEAVARATPLRTWLDGGVTVAGGSDAPVTPFEPLRGIWQSVTRFHPDRGESVGPDQCLTAQEALATYTVAAAYACFSEATGGALRPGLRADWVALSEDPLRCPPERLRDLAVLATAVGGELVHDAR